MNEFKDLERKLGLKFSRREFLSTALAHRSYLNEAAQDNLNSNERLEFLGDAILSFVVSEWLYREFPHHPEGNLTDLRSNMVKSEALAKIAQRLGVGDYLFLGKGEDEAGGRKNPLLLANTLEAIIGAIFLDQGLKPTENFIHRHFNSLLTGLRKQVKLKDDKSLLQEYLQAHQGQTPVYQTLKEEGPDHDKTFTVGVFSQNQVLASAIGKSKQQAQEEAAKLALEKIRSKT
jgi:ribonuclease-3